MFLVIVTTTLFAGCDFDTKERPSQSITFVSTRDFDGLMNAGEIYTMKFDGTELRRITNNSEDDRQPNFSPNGKRIVFSRGAPSHPGQEIYVMNADGTGEVRLTDNDANDQMAAFSPNGEEIVFTSSRDGNPEIYIMNSDGSNVRRLTVHDGIDQYPTWSPNGKQIAFSRDSDPDPDVENADIYVMNDDGTRVTRLTSNRIFEYKPSWSPDGKCIAFAVFLGDHSTPSYHEIWLMNADGSDVHSLTPKPAGVSENEWDNRWPVWSNDGRHIYFQSVRLESVTQPDALHPQGFDIFRMDADGGNPINLTQHFGVDATPDVR